jgi:hypothetical protein
MNKTQAKLVKFAAAYTKAAAAGFAAGNAAKTTTMVLTDTLNGQVWVEPAGPCGFAWVNVSPGTSSFAKWLVKNKYARSAYDGGVDIWVSSFNQSIERKEACARAMAETLRAELGVTAYPMSRLD